MTSSIIKDLEFFIDDEISFPVSMVILKRLHFSKYDSSHLVPQAYDFGHFFMVVARRIVIPIFVLVAISSTIITHTLG
jgi:hypothetical protein